jgi:hypothetical protein
VAWALEELQMDLEKQLFDSKAAKQKRKKKGKKKNETKKNESKYHGESTNKRNLIPFQEKEKNI